MLYPNDTHLFRPYVHKVASKEDSSSPDLTPVEKVKSPTPDKFVGNDGVGDAYSSSGFANDCGQSLLWVHQTQWQKQLLSRYGNEICLLDATYKTLSIPEVCTCMYTI